MNENNSYIMVCCKNDEVPALNRLKIYSVLKKKNDQFFYLFCPNKGDENHVIRYRGYKALPLMLDVFVCPVFIVRQLYV